MGTSNDATWWIPSFGALRLDIVGIVAVLGEGCTARTSQASALSWSHIIPRLLPAPQALLRHELERRLPTQAGIVVGVYSGNVKHELNFFCQLLHHQPLKKNQVQQLRVYKDKDAPVHDEKKCLKCIAKPPEHCKDLQAFDVRSFGVLTWLSVVGLIMAISLIIVSAILEDAFALLATGLLASTSTIVGYASWWNLDFKEEHPREDRKKVIPDSDIIICYPSGAFRVIRCEEEVSRLYFKSEICKPVVSDNQYKALALTASVFLMGGLLCMGNAHNVTQVLFAGNYIVLNVLYWASSSMETKTHWESNYKVEEIKFDPPRRRKIVQPQPETASSAKPTHGSQQPAAATQSQPSNNTQKQASDTATPSTVNGTQSSTRTAGLQPDLVTQQINNAVASGNLTNSPITTTFTDFGSKDGMSGDLKQRRTLTVTFSEDGGDTEQPQQLRRRWNTDLEGNKERNLQPTRSLSDPVRQSLSDLPRKALTFPLKLPFSQPIRSLTDSIRYITGLRQPTVGPEENVDALWEEDTVFTAALWQAIALTGSIRWLRNTQIAPDTDVWEKWIVRAGLRAAPKRNAKGQRVPPMVRLNKDGEFYQQLPPWDYQGTLNRLFEVEEEEKKRRLPEPRLVKIVQLVPLSARVRIILRRKAAKAREQVKLRAEGKLPPRSLPAIRSPQPVQVQSNEVVNGVGDFGDNTATHSNTDAGTSSLGIPFPGRRTQTALDMSSLRGRDPPTTKLTL